MLKRIGIFEQNLAKFQKNKINNDLVEHFFRENMACFFSRTVSSEMIRENMYNLLTWIAHNTHKI